MPTAGRRLLRRLEIGLPRRSRARRRPSPTQRALFRSAQADRRPKAPGGRIHSARRPTPDRRLSCRLKSAFQGALAPGVGLRRRKRHLPGRRRPTAGRRPPQAAFIRRTCRPPAEGCCADWKSAFQGALAPGVGLRRRKERFSGRRRPTVGRRPREAEFIRRQADRPKAEGLPLSRRASASADAKDTFPRPTAGRRPPQAAFIRRPAPLLSGSPPGPAGPAAPRPGDPRSADR
jgi:hypothetical protein